jgi:hypothetical protein
MPKLAKKAKIGQKGQSFQKRPKNVFGDHQLLCNGFTHIVVMLVRTASTAFHNILVDNSAWIIYVMEKLL